MAARWTKKQEVLKRKELVRLYVIENKSIGEIATILKIGQSTVYDRLLKLGIKPVRYKKIGFNHKRNDIVIPKDHSEELSEFIGVLLGDGHLTPSQVTITLGSKESAYVDYIAKFIRRLLCIEPKTIKSRRGHYVVYFGSVDAVRWLLSMGLVFNKVKSQVDVPSWIFSNPDYMKSFLRGFFDTDGSVYKSRFGIQLAFTNRSLPMLRSLQYCLSSLGYNPSRISRFRIYVTRRKDILNFFKAISPANTRHQQRFRIFLKSVGSPVGAGGGL